MQVGPQARAKGFRAIWCDSLASTNDEAMALARAGEPSGLWVLAGEQTQGRGRQGRPWSSPRGNFHGSVLLVEPCAPRFAPQLGFVAGVSVLAALRALAPDAPFALKWPNDVLCGGGKLAGVLIEGATLPGGEFACVIGFGVNCTAAPQGLPYRATDLTEVGVTLTAANFLPTLSDALAQNLDVWRAGYQFSAIRSHWLSGAYGLGRPIEARTHAGSVRGVFETIDEHGRLVISSASGNVTVEAADVFPLGDTASAVSGTRT
ncbi:MAG: biotin--[acetyl-CoA-carboxylase] ligase [Beijerinckiaceae bacterium]|nr:biotin--[acetyl-CoA-carboxylase] ligase [Beijerinckiaceae bacterium]